MLARLREWVRDLQVRYGDSERQVCFALRARGDDEKFVRPQAKSFGRVHSPFLREGVGLDDQAEKDGEPEGP